MIEGKKTVALVFPPTLGYSRSLTMGIVDRHLTHRDWTMIEVPRLMPGQSPFEGIGVNPDAVITWAEPRDRWVLDLVRRGIPVVNCGGEWVGVDGIASVHFDFVTIHRAVLRHFAALGLERVVAVGHALDQRPATRRVLEDFVAQAAGEGMEGQLWELDGEDSPAMMPRRLLATEREVALAAFLKGLRKPAGIYCMGSHIGFIVAAVAARLGIRVPGKLAVVGYGDNTVSLLAARPLTTVTGPAHEVGKAAVDCLAEWFKTGRPPFQDMSVPGVELIERESTVGNTGCVIMEAVRRHIDHRAKKGITLDELVHLSGLSVKTLVRKYREHFGSDPTTDIHQRRIEEIRSMLENRSFSMTEIASACGFSSQAAFANYYQRHAGCSPGEWRRRNAADVA